MDGNGAAAGAGDWPAPRGGSPEALPELGQLARAYEELSAELDRVRAARDLLLGHVRRR